MSNRAHKAQQHVIDEKIEEMTIWYLANNGGIGPNAHAVDKKTYRGLILHWLEPRLPHPDFPILIEEQLGDSWTLRMEPMGTQLEKLIGG
jgi:hypothetical protein